MRADVSARFWAKVDKSGECWIWTACHFLRDGRPTYGMFSFGGRLRPASRVAWELVHGQIPQGLMVRHSCDNRGCVRPEHLSLGTHQDNMNDMVSRGRAARGQENVNGRFTADQVRGIRRRVANGERTTDLAREYGVSQGAIWFIGARWRYKWVED
jgi:hypothetical protein